VCIFVVAQCDEEERKEQSKARAKLTLLLVESLYRALLVVDDGQQARKREKKSKG